MKYFYAHNCQSHLWLLPFLSPDFRAKNKQSIFLFQWNKTHGNSLSWVLTYARIEEKSIGTVCVKRKKTHRVVLFVLLLPCAIQLFAHSCFFAFLPPVQMSRSKLVLDGSSSCAHLWSIWGNVDKFWLCRSVAEMISYRDWTSTRLSCQAWSNSSLTFQI